MWADQPSQRVQKLHAACCKMMEFAGNLEYVESLMDDLDDMEMQGTLANYGRSDVSMLLRMKGVWEWSDAVELEDMYSPVKML